MNLIPQARAFRPEGESTSAQPASRDVAADLVLARGGGRTVLTRQHVPYPFHITRPFALDRDLPELATLYLQSASGGLYRGDRLRLGIRVGAGAMAHLTSQAATVVHRTPGAGAQLSTHIRVAEGGFLGLTNDPFILFPEANFTASTEVRMEPGARAILSDGFVTHDPKHLERPFERLETGLRILDGHGGLIAADRGVISGRAFTAPGSPLGGYRALGSMVVLGPRQVDIDVHAATAELDAAGCCIGISELPNEGGLAMRCLARTGGQLACGLDLLFSLAFTSLFGRTPARRRK